jgi:hypothetical protein
MATAIGVTCVLLLMAHIAAVVFVQRNERRFRESHETSNYTSVHGLPG